ELQDAAVLNHDGIREQQQLVLHQLAEVVLEIPRIPLRIRRVSLQFVELQPLTEETLEQSVRDSAVMQHPPDLLFYHLRLCQAPLLDVLEQFPIRQAAPAVVGEPGGQVMAVVWA